MGMDQSEEGRMLEKSVESASTLSDQIAKAERAKEQGIKVRQVVLRDGVSLLDIARRYGDMNRR